jgi:hypothetical protein
MKKITKGFMVAGVLAAFFASSSMVLAGSAQGTGIVHGTGIASGHGAAVGSGTASGTGIVIWKGEVGRFTQKGARALLAGMVWLLAQEL